MMRVVAGQILASVRADFSPLQKEYRLSVSSESPVTLSTRAAGPQPVRRAGDRHLLARGPNTSRSVTVREKGGDQTIFSFTDVEVNRPLPDGTF